MILSQVAAGAKQLLPAASSSHQGARVTSTGLLLCWGSTSQRTTCGSPLFSPIMWALGIRLISSGLVASDFTFEPSHQPGIKPFLESQLTIQSEGSSLKMMFSESCQAGGTSESPFSGDGWAWGPQPWCAWLTVSECFTPWANIRYSQTGSWVQSFYRVFLLPF